jgi:hypothetical protein
LLSTPLREGGVMPISSKPGDPEVVCPICGRPIGAGDSVGDSGTRVMHLVCYLGERERKRRE